MFLNCLTFDYGYEGTVYIDGILDAGYEKLYSCKFGVLDYVYKHQDENE
jgi:hypothetical protein